MEIVFFKTKQKIFLKDDVILIAKFKEITGPFILRKLAQNLKRTSSELKTHLYASDPEDFLIFKYEFTAQVEKHFVIALNRLGSAVPRRRFFNFISI